MDSPDEILKASEETISCDCLECGEHFETTVNMETEEIVCPNCGSTDIEI